MLTYILYYSDVLCVFPTMFFLLIAGYVKLDELLLTRAHNYKKKRIMCTYEYIFFTNIFKVYYIIIY